MSVPDGPLPATKVDISNITKQRTIDEHYDMEDGDHEIIAPGAGVPELPQKSTLRGSRLLDNHGLKLGGAVDESGHGATTPHDVYLSSEEDASTDADDFSDYDYDSSVEDPESPTRTSHEVTARIVSVVFAGKPSIVDLSLSKKRSISMSSSSARSSTESIAKSATTTSPLPKSSTEERPATPASSTSSSNNNRRSSLLSDMLAKKKPPFLSIDPYANGSSYSLNIPKALDSLESESPSNKTPRTPTQILKGVTRSFSLVRKRSRPMLSAPKLDTSVPLPRASTSSSMSKRSSLQQSVHMGSEEQQQEKEEDRVSVMTPQTPVTYNDILRAVKKNSMMMPPPSDVLSPTSPSTEKTAKRGILSGLAAKRRSVKLVGKQWP
ncbi:hypothetical protein QBC35DRAFT_134261 [Podospora australis]|uniref:Uncharacterized protein n=1 Tax=Podospora australis TaxID=1536484 RepID=A0AAN6WXA7_9PEZI|nr:hypothetical protein QBC35DRAFT_134261 [Podospora australis]